MKTKVLLIGFFLSLQISLYAQTYYINGTTDASSGNQPLIHSNELKIGNSTLVTERAKNMIKIGDGSYIQIGEWEADDLLSFKASKYNFTNGNVGIGTAAPTVKLDVRGSVYIPSGQSYWIGSTTDSGDRLRLHHAGAGGCIDYAPSLYFRAGTTNVMFLGQDGNLGVGTTSPQYKLDVNGTSRITGNAVFSGNVGIGTTAPTAKLDVSGAIKATSLSLTGALTANSLTVSEDLRIGTTAAPENSYGKKLHFGIPGKNGDGMFMARYNLEYDKAELRVDMGNDYNDKFVIGRKFWDQPEFEPMFTVVTNGNVGIGISNPKNKLDVNGEIRAKEVKIETDWADFVFNEDYRLKPLSEVNRFIQENKHLPEIPSATEVRESEGVNLGEMQVKLLQKIEELTLYLIQQENTIQELKSEIRELKEK
jgi:hypothetical protein